MQPINAILLIFGLQLIAIGIEAYSKSYKKLAILLCVSAGFLILLQVL